MIRKSFIVFLVLLVFFAAESKAFNQPSIEKNVAAIIAAIDRGRDPSGIAADAYTPYVFILEKNGLLLVHPTLAGENLQGRAEPIYQALLQATPNGVWVRYSWRGKEKHTFARLYDNHLIVASGY
ncbi:MAG: hypothetical protein PHI97_09410 [Desulfobulbus sp.]|nr:hypothetical protein [Desulfobulbus sp.]